MNILETERFIFVPFQLFFEFERIVFEFQGIKLFI